MVDIIARGLAVQAGGEAGNSYTKAETDELLLGKQNVINAQNKLLSDFIEFNLTEEDIVRLWNEAKAANTTRIRVDGDNIQFLSDVSTDGDNIKIETESTFGYKDKIFL